MPSTQIDRINGLTTSVAVKAPVRVVATSNVTLSGLQTISGVTLVAGDRVLCIAQTSSHNNGIYVASSGDWTRAADFDGPLDITQGTLVVSASSSPSLYYRVTSTAPITIGTDAITFEAVAGTQTAESIGEAIYPRSAEEIAASVTPTLYQFKYMDPRRYGAAGDGVTDDSAAFELLESIDLPESDLGGMTYAITSIWDDAVNGVVLSKDYTNGTLLVDGRPLVFDRGFSFAASGSTRRLSWPHTNKKLGVYRVDENNYYVWRPLGGQYWQRCAVGRDSNTLPLNWWETYIKQVAGYITAESSDCTYNGDWTNVRADTYLKSADPATYLSGRARQAIQAGDYVDITYTGGGDLYVVFVGRTSGNYVNVLLDSGQTYLCLPDDGAGNKYIDTYNSTDLSYHQIVKIASGVPSGSHTIRLTVSATKNGSSSGNKFIFNALAFDSDEVGPWTLEADAPLWETGVAVLQYEIRKYGTRYYYATADGTTGATPPTHSSGTVSDGTVSWTQRDDSGYNLTDHRIHAAGSQLEYAYEIKPTGASAFQDVGGDIHGNETQDSLVIQVGGLAASLDDGVWAVGDSVAFHEVISATHSQIGGGATQVVETELTRTFLRQHVEVSHRHTLQMAAQFGYFYAHMWPLLHYSVPGFKYGVQRIWSPGDGDRYCEDFYGVSNPFVGRTKDLVMAAYGDALQPDGAAGVPSAVAAPNGFVAWLAIDPSSVDNYNSATRIFAAKGMNTSGVDVSAGGYSSMTSKMYFERYSNATPTSVASGAVIECVAQYGLALTA
jgi:hypothetical protein